MSYELVFWKQTDDKPARIPQEIYADLMDDRTPAGLAHLPVDAILDRIVSMFPGAAREGNGQDEWLVWTSPNGKDSFEISWSGAHLRADCHHVHTDDMNKLIEIAHEFGCPLYDPQTNERFG